MSKGERTLDVYLKGDLVGTLEQNQSGTLTFRYSEAFIEASQVGISLSLPLRKEPHQGDSVKAFFSGLLPDESVRERLAKSLGLSEKNAFALLRAIGGECAGALSLYPQGTVVDYGTKDIETLDDHRLREILDLIKRQPMLANEGLRLSLAGAQYKLAVGFEDGKVLLIKGGAATTHILKPIIDDVKDSAHNEYFCMRLAEIVGLDVPQASLHYVGDVPYYLVQRYDRIVGKNGFIERIHQEDFCQALGIAPEIKYEREGGPSIAQCHDLLTRHAGRPAADRIKLNDVVIYNYLIGNADAHGKNFALLYRRDKPELAPAYDLLSTAVYPGLAENMAMKIGGKYKPRELSLRHFHRLVPDTKAARDVMDRRLKELAQKTVENALLLKDEMVKMGHGSSVVTEIIKVIGERARRLTIAA